MYSPCFTEVQDSERSLDTMFIEQKLTEEGVPESKVEKGRTVLVVPLVGSFKTTLENRRRQKRDQENQKHSNPENTIKSP